MENTHELKDRASQLDQAARWLVFLGGVAGPILFVAAFTIDGLLRPGYSPIHQAISDLGVGPDGSLMDGLAVVIGLLWIGFALSLTRIIRPAEGRVWLWIGSFFLALRGLAFITVAIFTEAPATVRIHSLGASIGLSSLLIALFAMGIGLRQNSSWRGWGNATLAACLATLALVALEFWAFTPGTLLAPAQLGGLMERLVYLETLAWYVAFGWRLFKRGE